MSELTDGSNLLGDMIARLATKDNSEPGDYYDDEGFLMCHKCHTRKQYELDVLGHMRRVPVLCECGKEALEREKEAQAKQETQARIRRLQEKGIADAQYLKWRIEADDRQNPKVSDAVARYAEKWDEMLERNMGILFYGNVGTGKTFFAACIANALIERGIGVMMTNIPSLMSAMSKDFEKDKAKLLWEVSNIPLLILDDVGVERDTAYGYEKIQEIIDTRYRSGKPLIVTTNLSPSELKNPQDLRYKRVYDRILEMCYPILVDGRSRREGKAKSMRMDARDILGI